MHWGFPQHHKEWEGTSGHLNSCFLLWGSPPSRPSFSRLRLVSCYRQEGPLLPHSPMLGNEEAREDGSIIASHPTLRIYLCPPQEAETRTFSSDPFCGADPKGVALTSQGNEANLMPERLGRDFRGLPPFPHSLSTCWLCPPQRVKGLTAGQGRPGPCPRVLYNVTEKAGHSHGYLSH